MPENNPPPAPPVPVEFFHRYVTVESLNAMEEQWECSNATLEVIFCATLLQSLAEDTFDFADSPELVDFPLSQEEARQRAEQYRASYEALKTIWEA